eukprot:1945297-Amphidinium_carterae.1
MQLATDYSPTAAQSQLTHLRELRTVKVSQRQSGLANGNKHAACPKPEIHTCCDVPFISSLPTPNFSKPWKGNSSQQQAFFLCPAMCPEPDAECSITKT